jgi:hypothetical protein
VTLPISERAINAVMDALRQVAPENNYYTDAGRRVSREVQSPETGDSPQLLVFEEGEEVTGGAANNTLMSVTLSLIVATRTARSRA